MATTVTINGTNYSIPASGESNWGNSVSSFLIAVASNGLFTGGGSRTLTADLNLGATYGLIAPYYKSSGSNISTAGVLRLANAESIGWRNQANAANLLLTVNSSDRLQFDSINIPTISSTDTLTNKSIDADSNTLTNIANAAIKAGAAIDQSKLSLSITNAEVNASAAIALSKLAATTASRALVSDGSGFISAASVTATELGYVSGVTSAIQTQLDAKFASADVIDEDNMASNLATKVPTQQSVKAYVDTQVSSVSASGAEYSAKSADYTVTDVDNIRVIGMTTGAADKTITLPTAADNTNRIITIKKVDSGDGDVIIDGEGSETIDGATTYTIADENEATTLVCTGTEWESISDRNAGYSCIHLSDGNGHGSTGTKIRRFTTTQLSRGRAITYTDSATNGASFTINVSGMYAIAYTDRSSSAGAAHGVSIDASSLTTDVTDLAESQTVNWVQKASANHFALAGATIYLTAGTVVRPHTTGLEDAGLNVGTKFIISRIG